MNYEQLKNSILGEAIEGRLVPQDPNDEPASVLLDRIADEKNKLAKEKKIKRDKNESRIVRSADGHWMERFFDKKRPEVCIDEEIPFEIPDSWEWCRLKSLCSNFSTGPFGTMIHKSDYVTEGGIPLINPTNIIQGKIDSANIKRVSKSKAESLGSYILKEGDVILARRGDLSKCATIEQENENWLCGTGSFFLHPILIDLNYFLLFYGSNYVQTTLTSISVGTTMNNLNQNILANLLFPIPPFSEQHRIVEKLEQILPKVEEYGEAQERLDALNRALPEKLKASILQEAIEGRLVPQNADDEPASVLLDKIEKARLALVKAKKLKPDKNASRIYRTADGRWFEHFTARKSPDLDITEEVSYEVPESWELVRLSYILQLIDGEKRQGNNIVLDAKYLRGKSQEKHLSQGKFVHKGDDIILVDGENSGEVFSVPTDGYMGSTFKQLWLTSVLDKQYLLYNLLVYKEFLRKNKKGAAIPHLNKDIFYNIIIGIPPINEQRRIVSCLEEMLPKLNLLQANINCQ